MSTQVVPPRQLSPFWQVQAVFDPDGLGRDFAYTIGLDSVGLPELHLFARPTAGDDPAPDWKFSNRDLGALLNEFAGMQLRRDLVVGTVVEREFDGGMARVRFEVQPPGDRAALEALGIAPGAQVLPIRWSLDPAREGQPQELDESALAQARFDYAALARPLARTVVPPGWRIYVRPRFTTSQRFGPLTALVHARAIAIAQASPEQMARFVELALCSQRIGALGSVVAQAAALARQSGRGAAIESVRLESSRLAGWLALPVRSSLMSLTLDMFTGDLDAEDACGHLEAADALNKLLTSAVAAMLMTQVVADVASEELMLMGMGPWLSAASETGLSPGARWHADEAVVAQVEAVLKPRAGRTLGDLVGLHERALSADPRATSRGDAYRDVVVRLLGMGVSSAALSPPVRVHVSGMPVHSDEASRAETAGVAAALGSRLTTWASLLTCAIAHRAHLSDEDVSVFAEPYLQVCPEIEGLLAPDGSADGSKW